MSSPPRAGRRQRVLPLVPANRLLRQEMVAFYLFASPWLIGLLLLTLGPMLAAVGLSLTDYPVIVAPKWVGLKNYAKLLDDDLVRQALKVTFLYAAGAIPLEVISAFLVALLMNLPIRGISAFRTIYYLPAVISGVPVALLWMWILNPEFGVLNNLLGYAGIKGPAWLFSTEWVIPAFILMSLWKIGAPMIVYLAGLQGIPQHLYEAAEIDGAGVLARFWHVTVPMVSPVILFNAVMSVIGSFQIFTPAFVMTQGGPANASLVYVLYLYNNAFKFFRMGYAATLAWLLFFIILAFTLLVLRWSAAWVYYEGKLRG
ncbi:MAG TPA: sugar ABC transporter permease [Chloroflexota bacterium]